MKSAVELRDRLNRIDQKSYSAYKDLKGTYQFGDYDLSIDHVQADPFAPPSKIRVFVPGKLAGIPPQLYDKRHKRIALQDYLTRQLHRQTQPYARPAKGTGKSGIISVSRCGQEILERSACQIDAVDGDIVVRLEIGFPARGRTVMAKELEKILFEWLPQCVRKSLFYRSLDGNTLSQVANLAEDQQFIREQLPKRGLVAFVADGAVLPRESGISQRPMKDAVRFQSPPSLRVTLELPHFGPLTGMGIPTGVNLVVGGGYHGKSTLLKALELGVYNHIAGDGREYVITDDTAVKVRAEDGRSIQGVDISLFINGLPNGKNTHAFNTEDASGSTSQAANTVEAMEAGTGLFLIDEDTSATNFMIRDALMQQVVHRDSEPITPFIGRVRDLYERFGISSIVVVGSSGSYFHKADCVVQMDQYLPKEITAYAKEKAAGHPLADEPAPPATQPDFLRRPRANRVNRTGDHDRVKSMGMDAVALNKHTIDLRLVEQLVDPEQLPTLGFALGYAEQHLFDGKQTVQAVVEQLWELMQGGGVAAVCENRYLPCNLALPRKQEIFACLNRYRGLHV